MHSKLNNFLSFLKTEYPCNLDLTLKYYHKSYDKDKTGEIVFSTCGTQATITVIHKRRTQNDVLFTLAHEYEHARQFQQDPTCFDGPYGILEMKANFFADEALEKFKNRKRIK